MLRLDWLFRPLAPVAFVRRAIAAAECTSCLVLRRMSDLAPHGLILRRMSTFWFYFFGGGVGCSPVTVVCVAHFIADVG